MIKAAGTGPPDAPHAVSTLCEIYSKPIVSYILSLGYSQDEALDLSQAFFLRLLENDFFASISEEGGKFRTYLKKSIRNFLHYKWKMTQAQKREGSGARADIDSSEISSNRDDERQDAIFDREWVLKLISVSLDRVRDDWAIRGNSDLFAELVPHLTRTVKPRKYGEIAELLSISETAVRKRAERLRKQFSAEFRRIVLETIDPASDQDLETELRDLRAVFEPRNMSHLAAKGVYR